MNKIEKIDAFEHRDHTWIITLFAVVIIVAIIILSYVGQIATTNVVSYVTLITLVATLLIVRDQASSIKINALHQYEWDKRKATTEMLRVFRDKLIVFAAKFKDSELSQYWALQKEKDETGAIPLEVLNRVMYENGKRTTLGDNIIDFLNMWEHLSLSVRYHIYDFGMVYDIMRNLVIAHYSRFEELIRDRNKSASGASDCLKYKPNSKTYQHSWCEFCSMAHDMINNK